MYLKITILASLVQPILMGPVPMDGNDKIKARAGFNWAVDFFTDEGCQTWNQVYAGFNDTDCIDISEATSATIMSVTKIIDQTQCTVSWYRSGGCIADQHWCDSLAGKFAVHNIGLSSFSY